MSDVPANTLGEDKEKSIPYYFPMAAFILPQLIRSDAPLTTLHLTSAFVLSAVGMYGVLMCGTGKCVADSWMGIVKKIATPNVMNAAFLAASIAAGSAVTDDLNSRNEKRISFNALPVLPLDAIVEVKAEQAYCQKSNMPVQIEHKGVQYRLNCP